MFGPNPAPAPLSLRGEQARLIYQPRAQATNPALVAASSISRTGRSTRGAASAWVRAAHTWGEGVAARPRDGFGGGADGGC